MVFRSSSQLILLASMPRAMFGFVVIALIVISATFAPWIAPFDPNAMDYGALMQPPSSNYLLGTDQLGRDVLSRLIYGARAALLVSILGVGCGVLFGLPMGLASVYFRGLTDDIIMRFTDALAVLPGIIIAVGLAGVIGGSVVTVVAAIGIANIPWIARVVRSQGLIVREHDFVAAAVAGGIRPFRIICRHVFPHTVAPAVVQATLGMGYAVLFEAALGFIGIGVQPPTATWGNMLQQAYPFLSKSPLLSIVPGCAIFLLVLAFNFVGDSMRDVLDPRLKGIL